MVHNLINIFTIGVYNSTEDSYFNKLIENKIDLFCDIRQRRGVRGAKYKYVNSSYLQEQLVKLGINYLYIKDLAPTNDVRQKQKDADEFNGVTKKLRTSLGLAFKQEYQRQILEKFDFDSLIHRFQQMGVKNVVFFCVEEHAEACHRSLVAKRLAEQLHIKIINL